MKAYAAIFKVRLATLFQYRAAALAGLSTQLFWGLLKIMILSAFYAHATTKEPLSLSQTINFIWLSQALLQLVPWNIDRELEGQIKNGNVSYELIRPLDLYSLWFSRVLAMRVVPTFLRALPLFLISFCLLDLTAPVSLQAGISFAVSLIFSVFLSSSISTLVIISLFWTLSGEGILRLLPHVVSLLSGMILPLPLFPSIMQPFLSIQPFRGIIDIPTRLYTGIIPHQEAIYYILFQLAWTLIIILCGRKLLKKALRQFVVQGG